MADSVRIVIEADDKTAAGITSAITNMNKLVSAADKAKGSPSGGGGGSGVAGLSGAFKTLNNSLSAIGLPAIGFTAALGGIVAITKNAINEGAKYNEQVRDLSYVTGTGAEKTSRMLQVLDDFQIGAEDVTTATKALTKQGLAPTVETLAKLSDQYLQLNTAQEKNAFITKNLGKGGLQWVNLLNQGSDAIMQLNDGVSSNLILTDEQIKKYEQYRLRMDQVSDSIQGAKVAAGNFFFDQADQIGAGIDKTTAVRDAMKNMGFNANLGRGSQGNQLVKDLEMIYEQAQITGISFEKMSKWATPLDSATLSYIQMAKAAQQGNAELQQGTVDYKDLVKSGMALTRQQESYKDSVEKIHKTYQNGDNIRELFKQDVTALRQELARTGDYQNYYQKVGELQQSFRDGSYAARKEAEAVGELNKQQQLSAAQFALNLMQQDEAYDPEKVYDFAAATGQITQAAAEQYKGIKKINQAYADGTINAEQAAEAISNVSGDIKDLGGMSVATYVDVFVRMHGSIPTDVMVGPTAPGAPDLSHLGSNYTHTQNATGTTNLTGPVISRVGERGEEGLIVREDGSIAIVPNSLWMKMRDYGVTPDQGFAAGGLLATSAAGNLRRTGGRISRSVPIMGKPIEETQSATAVQSEVATLQTTVKELSDAVKQMASGGLLPTKVALDQSSQFGIGYQVGLQIKKITG